MKKHRALSLIYDKLDVNLKRSDFNISVTYPNLQLILFANIPILRLQKVCPRLKVRT